MAKKPALKFDAHNVRKHDQRNLDAIKASLAELGAGRSIVCSKDGTVLGGNGTLKQAQELGIDVDYVHTTGDRLIAVIRDDLAPDDPRAIALALADNRTSDLSDWDFAGLADELTRLDTDMQGIAGFTPEDIERMFDVAPGAGEVVDLNNPPPGEKVTHKCPKCGFVFEDNK